MLSLVCFLPSCDKVSMLTHSSWRFKWPSAVTRLTAHFMSGLISALVICELKECNVVYDAKCPYWDQASLDNIKFKPHIFSVFYSPILSCQILWCQRTRPYPWWHIRRWRRRLWFWSRIRCEAAACTCGKSSSWPWTAWESTAQWAKETGRGREEEMGTRAVS